MELSPEYEKELSEIKQKMLDAQEFSDKFPCFSEAILRNKCTNEFTGGMETQYGSLYYDWGINRHFYRKKENITNYSGKFEPQYLWNVYINQYSLFGENYTETGLREIKNKVDLFFYDWMNSTFYATDNQLIKLLDALSEWYDEAKLKNKEFANQKKKQYLLDQLKKIEEAL